MECKLPQDIGLPMHRWVHAAFLCATVLPALFAAPAIARADITASGTGFFANAEGWIVTNAHVLDGCRKVTVPSFADEITSWVIDPTNDLAAFKLTSGAGRAGLPLRAEPARLGEEVAALGYPL